MRQETKLVLIFSLVTFGTAAASASPPVSPNAGTLQPLEQNRIIQQSIQEKKYAVQFNKLYTEEKLKSILPNDSKIIHYIDQRTWLVETSSDPINLKQLDKVKYVGKYRYNQPSNPQNSKYIVKTVPGEAGNLLEKLSSSKIKATRLSNKKIVVEDNAWKINQKRYQEIVGIRKKISELKRHNAEQRKNIDSERLQTSPQNLEGQGFSAAVWDLNISGGHKDLTYPGKRIVGDPGLSPGEHATHVSATLLGAGKIDNTYRGIATNSTLITYGLQGDTNTDIMEEVNESIVKYGADISQNSWGLVTTCTEKGDYRDLNSDYDAYISNTSLEVEGTIPTVFSAGNSALDCPSPYNTTSPPGNAKNIVTVGALRSQDQIASFSSRGPTDSGRLKPTVSALGVNVKSAVPGNTYTTKQGTSMAAPTVAGGMIQIAQKYNRTYGRKPIPAESKALLIHTAEPLGVKGPDFKYGWGRPNITSAVNYIEKSKIKSTVKTGSIGLREKDKYQFQLRKDTSHNITLVWSDPPGNLNNGGSLINDLDLVVETENQRYYPWTKNYSQRGSAAVRTKPDRTNPVEQVHIPSLQASEVNITVNGTEVPQPDQSYSLIVSNKVKNQIDIKSPQNTTLKTNPDAKIKLNFEASSAEVQVDGTNHSLNKVSSTEFQNTSIVFDDGKGTATFYVNDTQGNTYTNSVTYTKDTSPPSIQIQSPIDNANLSQTINTNATAQDKRTTTTKLFIQQNGTVKQQKTGFNHTFTSNSLSQGQANLTFFAGDEAGNTVNQTVNITIDRQRPNITILTEKFVSPPYNISAAVQDNQKFETAKFNITQNNKPKKTGSLNQTLTETSLANGTYNATYNVSDYAGNYINKTQKITVDSEKPNFTYKTQPEFINKTPYIKAAGKDNYSGIQNINYTVFNGTFAQNLSINTTEKLDGLKPGNSYNVRINLTDKAGNKNTSKYTVTVDTNPPTLEVRKPSNHTILNGSTSFNATAQDNKQLKNISAKFQSNETRFKTNINTTIPTSQRPDRNYTVNYVAQDTAGNLGTKIYRYVIDNEPPKIQINNLQNNSNISGSFNIDAEVTEPAGIQNTTYIVRQNGNTVKQRRDISRTLDTTQLQEGEYNITVNATSTTQRTRLEKITSVTIDNTPPDLKLQKYPSKPQNGDFYKNQLKVEATCTDNLAGPLKISNNTDTRQKFETNFTVKSYRNTTYSCLDYAGNNASLKREFKVDSVPPRIETIIPSNNSEITTGDDIVVEIFDEESGISTISTKVGSPNSDFTVQKTSTTLRIEPEADPGTSPQYNLKIRDNALLQRSVTLSYSIEEEATSNDNSGGSSGGGGGGGGLSTTDKEKSEDTQQNGNQTKTGQTSTETETKDQQQTTETSSTGSDSSEQTTEDTTTNSNNSETGSKPVTIQNNNATGAEVRKSSSDDAIAVVEDAGTSEEVELSVSKQYLEENGLEPSEVEVFSQTNTASYTIEEINEDSVVYSVNPNGAEQVKLQKPSDKDIPFSLPIIISGVLMISGGLLLIFEFLR